MCSEYIYCVLCGEWWQWFCTNITDIVHIRFGLRRASEHIYTYGLYLCGLDVYRWHNRV